MPPKLQLIGVAGTGGAGKDTVAEILVRLFGMRNLSSGDMARAITRQVYHMPADAKPLREELFIVANYLRSQVNPAALVLLCILEARVGKVARGVVTGMRSMGEAQAVRDAGGIIVGVDADPHIRYQRMSARQRDAETQKTLEEFLEHDEYENRGISDQGPGRGIRAIIDSADVVLDNSSDLAQLELEIKNKVAPLLH